MISLDAPAQVWTDALPVGNGTLGAMVFGRTATERLQINHDSCWSGWPNLDPIAPLLPPGEGPEQLRIARQAALAGDIAAAEAAVQLLQSGNNQAYQPLVDLWISSPGAGKVTEYQRALDLRDGVARHSFTRGGIQHRQRVIASFPDQVLVIERTSSEPIDLTITLGSLRPWLVAPEPARPAESSDNTVLASVRMPGRQEVDWSATPPTTFTSDAQQGVTAVIGWRAQSDGDVNLIDGELKVTQATVVQVLLTVGTDAPVPGATAFDPALRGNLDALTQTVVATLDAATAVSRELVARHLEDHHDLMDRVTLDLGPEPSGPSGEAPTTQERLVAVANGEDDPNLAALAFEFGRYLLVAGSRPGSRPANLQGIWNDQLTPPWRSNYTVNINLEMNYSGVLAAGLPECNTPLLDWLPVLAASGQRVARELYDLPGWTSHHNSDVWGFALPTGHGTDQPSWSFWPLGGVWLARHIADHDDFTADDDALTAGWPILVGAAEFALAWLIDLPDGSLGTAPSTSPENTYLLPDGSAAHLGTSTTADLAMIRELLEVMVGLAPRAEAIGLDGQASVMAAARDALDRLPRERILPDGRLAEWAPNPATGRDETDAEPLHRHTSHLYRVFPGHGIDPDTTPELATAALATLAGRGPHSTGWALAWRIALNARLQHGEGVAAGIHAFLHPVDAAPGQVPDPLAETGISSGHTGGAHRTLLCAHPPFQIDGNYGFVAGVLEALVQGHRILPDGVREVHLLPAAPPSWQEGNVRGVRLRGGWSIDLVWREGEPTSAVVTSLRGESPRELDLRWKAGGQTHRRRITVGDAPVSVTF